MNCLEFVTIKYKLFKLLATGFNPQAKAFLNSPFGVLTLMFSTYKAKNFSYRKVVTQAHSKNSWHTSLKIET